MISNLDFLVRVGSEVGDNHFHMSEKVWSDNEVCAHKPLFLHLVRANYLILARMIENATVKFCSVLAREVSESI